MNNKIKYMSFKAVYSYTDIKCYVKMLKDSHLTKLSILVCLYHRVRQIYGNAHFDLDLK